MRTVFCAFMILCLSTASAQKSYLTAGVGFGFSSAGVVDENFMPYTDSNTKGTLGKGMTYGFNIGYMVNKTAGIDLGIWYVAGSTFKVDRYDSMMMRVPSRFRGNTLRIMPSLKIAWGEKHKPYLKLGLVLGIATDAEYADEYSINNTCVISPYIITHKFSGGASIGWAGAVGINFSEEEKTSLFIEVNFIRQEYEPTQETVDACGSATITYQLVDKPNPNNPDEKLKPTFPFSCIGINAGVKFLLGGKNKDASQSPVVK